LFEKKKNLFIIGNGFFQWDNAPKISLFEKKKKKTDHKLKRFLPNGIRPPKIGLFEEKKKNSIIILNGFEKLKEA